MANNENNLDAYNAVEAVLGGAGAQPNDIVAVRAIAVAEGVSGGPASISDDNMALRLNAIDVGAGGAGDHLNTLDALNSIVVLKGGLGGHENDLDAINEWVDFALLYLLRATFNAADQDFADAQVLDTPAEGILNGQLTVVEIDGTQEILSNEVRIGLQSSPAFSDLGWVSQAVTRDRGVAFLFDFSADETISLINLLTSSTLPAITTGAENADAGFFLDYRAANLRVIPQAAALNGPTIAVPQQGVIERFAVVLGGYDSGAVWFTGQSGHSDGAAMFLEIGGSWTLLWRSKNGTASPLHAGGNFMGAVAGGATFSITDNWLVATGRSGVLAPAHLSLFEAPNGTSLDAITPEVGPAWTERSGDWDIQANRAACDGAGIATIASGEADAIVDCILNGGTSDNPASVLRLSDTSNHWYMQADRANNLLELHEVNATVDTVRASIGVTINDSTDYDVRAVLDGSTIDGYLDEDNKISYASATLNQTVENHGIRAETSLGRFDNFAVFARTSATYDTALDAL